MCSRAAVVGLGITDTGKVYGRTAGDFAAKAVRLAVADAGLVLPTPCSAMKNQPRRLNDDLSFELCGIGSRPTPWSAFWCSAPGLESGWDYRRRHRGPFTR